MKTSCLTKQYPLPNSLVFIYEDPQNWQEGMKKRGLRLSFSRPRLTALDEGNIQVSFRTKCVGAQASACKCAMRRGPIKAP
jgi:hypothetical protein